MKSYLTKYLLKTGVCPVCKKKLEQHPLSKNWNICGIPLLEK